MNNFYTIHPEVGALINKKALEILKNRISNFRQFQEQLKTLTPQRGATIIIKR